MANKKKMQMKRNTKQKKIQNEKILRMNKN